MKRIDTSTRVLDKFGAGKDGFTDGDPIAAVPATDLDASIFDNLQEELCSIVEGAGLALNGGVRTQVLQAIRRLLGGNATIVNAANSPFVLTADHAGLVIMDAVAGNISATLPAANVLTSLRYHFVRPDAAAYTATVDRAGADTIDGSTSFSLAASYDYRTIFASGGALWLTLAAKPTDQSPVGMCASFASNAALPTGWVKRNGAAYSRTTYAALFAYLIKSSTATITIASPGVVTWVGHGRSGNDPIKWTTTGALPTGLVVGTIYYVVTATLTTNTFQLSATPGGAAINTTGSQSGVHTAIHAPFGDGDGSTTFNVPEDRGEFERNWDDGRGVDVGRAFGSTQADAIKSHAHGIGHGFAFSAGADRAADMGQATKLNSDAFGGTETRPRSGGAKLAAIKAF